MGLGNENWVRWGSNTAMIVGEAQIYRDVHFLELTMGIQNIPFDSVDNFSLE
jgi:hypothetical protein